MVWLRKHLNWTTVIVPVVAGALGAGVARAVLMVTGASNLHFPGSFYSFEIQLAIIVADVVSLPCFGWVIKRKGRRLWYLLLFIPSLIPTPAPWSQIVFLTTFWLPGWIVVMALKSKYPTTQA